MIKNKNLLFLSLIISSCDEQHEFNRIPLRPNVIPVCYTEYSTFGCDIDVCDYEPNFIYVIDYDNDIEFYLKCDINCYGDALKDAIEYCKN